MGKTCSGGCAQLKCWLSSAGLLIGIIFMAGYWIAGDATFLGMEQDELFSSAVMLFLFTMAVMFSKSSGSCMCGGKK